MSSLRVPTERYRVLADRARRKLKIPEGVRSVAESAEPAAQVGELRERIRDLTRAYERLIEGRSRGPAGDGDRVVEEQVVADALRDALASHPVWAWLGQVGGVTPLLAGQLLGRLDVVIAQCPSAFWAYCGLATVPAEAGARHAQPSRTKEGTKTACRATGLALLRANSTYAIAYRAERARLKDIGRGPDQRRHLMSLRKMEKLFLTHLWLVWREALGLPVTQPQSGPDGLTKGPWDMIVSNSLPHRLT